MKKISILLLIVFQALTINSQEYKITRKYITPYNSFISINFIDNNTKKETTGYNSKEERWTNKLGVRSATINTKFDSNGNEKEKIIQKYSYGFLEFKKIFKYVKKRVEGYKKTVISVETIKYNKIGSITDESTDYYDISGNKIYESKMRD
jgi:hypothetical protein